MSNVRDFGAVGDGRADDTAALQHAVDQGDGLVELPRGQYRLTQPIRVRLAAAGRTALAGQGGTAKLLMAGPGPALQLIGTHKATADPAGFREEQWSHERMPTVRDLEIEGRHQQADGIRIEGVMQPTLTGLLIRRVRTAVHVTRRARNLLISHCHLYENHGVGVHLDEVDLHQSIISACHISYCRLGGVRIENSQIRNLQITGNDIEYNNNRAHQVPDADGEPTAEIFVDVRQGAVREGTISGNTLQATYSPQGANIRFLGSELNHRAGMWSITGNLIGSQWNNIHLQSVRGVTITGNYLYSGHHRNLFVENSRNIVVGANAFGHNPDYGDKELATGIKLLNSESCLALSGLLIEDAVAGEHTVAGAEPLQRLGLVELIGCRRVTLSGCQILDGTPCGLYVEDSRDVLVSGCMISDDRDPTRMEAAVIWKGDSPGSMISGCRIGAGSRTALDLADASILVDGTRL